MRLCIGVILTLIEKFKVGKISKDKNSLNISNEYIFKTMLEGIEEEIDLPNKHKLSEIKNCKINLKLDIINHILAFNLQNETRYYQLHTILENNSKKIINTFIDPNYIHSFIDSIIVIIENDDSISAHDIIGMNPEFTKNNVLSWKAFDVSEFLVNILYYSYTLKDNKQGQDTISAIDNSFIEKRINSLNYIKFNNSDDNKNRRITFNFYNSQTVDANNLPHELTNTMVICSTAQNVLFREEEYAKILNSITTQQRPNIFLHGMGGRGKTSLARMVYCHLKDKYDCCGWINYSGNIKQSLIADLNLVDYSDDTLIENDTQKKWQYIQKRFNDSTQTKLLVIDNVDEIDSIGQDPRKDKDLIALSSWRNMTIIITSRLPRLPGFNNPFPVDNLGDETNPNKCVELFYYYNPEAEQKRDTNYEIVKKLCHLAGYNAMVIELLAKGSIYKVSNLEEFYNDLVSRNFSCANDTLVETDHDYNVIKFKNDSSDYYEIGNETIATQIFKLFNYNTRSLLQQLILWDFHCLRESEKVSLFELNNWMGYSTKDIDSLVKEGWIKHQDGLFSIHPLVNQAISCSTNDSIHFWNEKQKLIKKGTYTNDIIVGLDNNSFFDENDSFEVSLRKLLFVDCLTYGGDFLSTSHWINLADFARRRGNVKLGVKYYKKAYEHYQTYLPTNYDDYVRAWKCTYFYGYMLSYTKANYQEAEKILNQALNISENMVSEIGMTDANMLMLATSLDHLGYILSNSLNNNLHRITKADYYLTESTNMRLILCNKNPEDFRLLHDYAWSLDNLGAFYANINIDEIQFHDNSNPNDIVYLSKEEVIENKRQSELMLLESLEIRKAISKLRKEKNSTEVAWTYYNLANLLMSLDNNNINDRILNNPNGIYFKLHENTSSSSNDLDLSETAWAYSNIATLLSTQNSRTVDAEKYIKEALDIYHILDIKYPGQHQSSEARTTVLYARLLSKIDTRKQEATKLYNKALSIYQILNADNNGAYIDEINTIKAEIKLI